MRIAFFHHSLRIGSGIDTVIYELARSLSKKGIDVTVFCFKSSYDASNCNFRLEEIKSSFSVDTSERIKFLLSPFILERMNSLISKMKGYDVINTHMYPSNYIVRNIPGPLNIVTEWSAGDPSIYLTTRERLYLRWIRYANKKAAWNADYVLAPCEFVNKWILSTYGIKPTTMFLDGVNFELFDRARASPDKFFESHPNLEGKKVILFVGRIADSKNIHSLIQAFRMIQQREHNSALVLVGDHKHYPEYFNKLRAIVGSGNVENNVIFTGVIPWNDLPSYFAASSVYATCSLWEGFLRAEAFAFGKPIVCFDVAANSETVRHYKTGLLVRGGDVDGFGSSLLSLLQDPELSRTLGENGYRWAKENLDFNSIAERFATFCMQHLERTHENSKGTMNTNRSAEDNAKEK